LEGKLVTTRTYSGEQKISLKTTDFSSGTYLLKVASASSSKQIKLTIH
jgi:hypothetical protein